MAGIRTSNKNPRARRIVEDSKLVRRDNATQPSGELLGVRSYSSRALSDLERISDFLTDEGLGAQLEALDLIDEAITILARHPLIGRQAEHEMRELVISQGRTGYVALYSHEIVSDVILILAVRHQRKAGFHG